MLLSTMAIAAQVPFWGSLQTAFEAIDLDESGAISFEEFKKCVLTWMWESKKNTPKPHVERIVWEAMSPKIVSNQS